MKSIYLISKEHVTIVKHSKEEKRNEVLGTAKYFITKNFPRLLRYRIIELDKFFVQYNTTSNKVFYFFKAQDGDLYTGKEGEEFRLKALRLTQYEYDQWMYRLEYPPF